MFETGLKMQRSQRKSWNKNHNSPHCASSMGDRGWADVEIPVGGKQDEMPLCEFLLYVSLSINFSKSYVNKWISYILLTP